MSDISTELAKEVIRVRKIQSDWIRMSVEHKMGPGMGFSIAMMGAEIDAAITNLGSQDVGRITKSLLALRSYASDS